jgi:DNA processing protein
LSLVPEGRSSQAAVDAVSDEQPVTRVKDNEVAAALDLTNAQTKAWLRRLVDEGVLEKKNSAAGYIVKQRRLFD